MRFTSRLRCFSLLWLLPLVVNAAQPTPIKIGEYGSLTGREAPFGAVTHKGITFAVEEINADGGVRGPYKDQ